MIFKAKVGLRFDEAAALKRLNLQSGGAVQRSIDENVVDFCIPYCPYDSGTLAETNPHTNTVFGSGEVVYGGPYAHYMYYGEVYDPNIPVFDDNGGEPTGFFSPPNKKKNPTGRELDFSKSKEKNSPLAGPFWFERMKADRLDDIVREAKKAVAGK